MAGVAGALASGIESGFGMARQMALDNERRSQTEIENKRKDEADRRATADLALRGAREARAAEHGEITDTLNTLTNVSGIIGKRKTELEGFAAAAQSTGRLLPPELATEHAQHTATLATIRQKALNLTSRLAGGQLSLDQVPPGDLYTSFAVTTGHKPEDFPKVRAAMADFQSAMETGNQGLTIQSLNTLMAPQLRRGLNQPSPHGGTIVSKELVDLVPAVDANGQPHPNRVFPVLRVTTDLVGPDGKPLTYMAPMSVGGGTADAPVALDITKGFEFLGNLGTALAAANNPAVASKLAAGAQVAGAGVDEFFKGELGLAGAARNTSKPGVDQARVDLVNRYMREKGFPQTAEGRKQAVKELHEMGAAVGPGVGAATLREKVATIDALDLSDEEKDRMKVALALGAKPETPLEAARRKKIDAEVAGTLPARPKARGTGLGGGTGGAAAPAKMDDAALQESSDALDLQAWNYINKRTLPYRKGVGGGADRNDAIVRRAARIASQIGVSVEDLAARPEEFKATAAALTAVTKDLAAIRPFKEMLDLNSNVLTTLAEKVTKSDVTYVNKSLNWLRKNITGNADVAEYLAQMQIVQTEAARVLNNPRLVGQLTDSARHEMQNVINGDMAVDQTKRIIARIQSDGKNRVDAMQREMAGLRQDLRSTGRAAPAPAAPVPAPAAGSRPQPMPADVEWAKQSLQNRETYIRAFGREP